MNKFWRIMGEFTLLIYLTLITLFKMITAIVVLYYLSNNGHFVNREWFNWLIGIGSIFWIIKDWVIETEVTSDGS